MPQLLASQSVNSVPITGSQFSLSVSELDSNAEVCLTTDFSRAVALDSIEMKVVNVGDGSVFDITYFVKLVYGNGIMSSSDEISEVIRVSYRLILYKKRQEINGKYEIEALFVM